MKIGNKKTLIRGVYLDGRREVQAMSQVPQNSKLSNYVNRSKQQIQ